MVGGLRSVSVGCTVSCVLKKMYTTCTGPKTSVRSLYMGTSEGARGGLRKNSKCRSPPCKPQFVFLMMVLWVDARDLAKNRTRSNSECRSRPCKPQRVFLMMVLWVDARDLAKNQTRSKCTRPSNTTKRFLMVVLQVCMRDLQKPGLVDTHTALKPTLRFLMVVLWGGLVRRPTVLPRENTGWVSGSSCTATHSTTTRKHWVGISGDGSQA